MKTKPLVGKWYQLSVGMANKTSPWRETHCVTKCMQVPGGVMIHNATYNGGFVNKQFTPSASSESMVFVPNVSFELDDEDNCIFNEKS